MVRGSNPTLNSLRYAEEAVNKTCSYKGISLKTLLLLALTFLSAVTSVMLRGAGMEGAWGEAGVYWGIDNIVLLLLIGFTAFIAALLSTLIPRLAVVFAPVYAVCEGFIIGFIFAIVGIAVITFNGKFILKINPLGDMLAILAAVMWGLYSALIKMIGDMGFHSITITKKTFMYGIIFMIPIMFFMGFDVNISDYIKPINLINFLFLSFVACTLCFIAWTYSTKILGAVRNNTYIYFIPIITLIASKIILNENITIFALIGVVLILLGVIISESNFDSFLLKKKIVFDARSLLYSEKFLSL